jgi:small neutral amino acid transporter SnatA (MarC family)
MEHGFVSALVLLLLVLDPFGSLPIFISVLRSVEPARRRRWPLREVASPSACWRCSCSAARPSCT